MIRPDRGGRGSSRATHESEGDPSGISRVRVAIRRSVPDRIRAWRGSLTGSLRVSPPSDEAGRVPRALDGTATARRGGARRSALAPRQGQGRGDARGARGRVRRHRHQPALRDAHGVRDRPQLRPTEATVYGVISLVFWAITLVVTLKYVTLIMRADNHGEGGIMALIALVRGIRVNRRATKL